MGDQTILTKTFKAFALTAVVALGFSASAANAATASATAKTSIIKQITVTKTADHDYTTVVTGATLFVAASQAKVIYTGTFVAMVNYQ